MHMRGKTVNNEKHENAPALSPMSLSYDDIGYKVSMKSKGEITADNCGLSFFLSSCNTNRQKLFCLRKQF